MNDKELNTIRKSLETAVKEKNRDNIIAGLAKLQIFIDESRYGFRDPAYEVQEAIVHELIKLEIPEGTDISKVDEETIRELMDDIFKEVDELKKKIKTPSKPKLTEEERVKRKIEKLVKEGLSPEEAEKFVATKELEKKGYKMCAACGRAIGPREDAIRAGNKWYHRVCFEKAKAVAFEEIEDVPFTIFGKVQYCDYCTEPILLSQGRTPICPRGTRYPLETPECRWFHGDCFRLMKEEEIEK